LFLLVVPHITDAIQEWVERVARISVDNDSAEPDICIVEVGQSNKANKNTQFDSFDSLEELSVISKACLLLKLFDNFNFVLNEKISVLFTSVLFLKCVVLILFVIIHIFRSSLAEFNSWT